MSHRNPLPGLLAATLLAACATSQPPGMPERLPDTGKPALHAVTDSRLRTLMDQLDVLLFDRYLTQPELDRERRKYSAQIVDSATQLGLTIDAILGRLPELHLEPPEQTSFRALANKLRDQANTLKVQAQQGATSSLAPTLAGISHTCTACHELFRNLRN